jgi:sortase A
MVSGVLLIADAGLTLAWQEPVSAYFAQRQQTKLKKELQHPAPAVRRRLLRFAPLKGDAIGEIELPSIHKKAFVVEGTDTGSLTKGPGHYPDTPLPGKHGTVGIAGHRTTHGAPFRHIDNLHRGDKIVLLMPYGTFTYRVEKQKIVPPTEVSVTKRVGYDRLILSACHPLYSAAQRLIVFARFVKRTQARVVS